VPVTAGPGQLGLAFVHLGGLGDTPGRTQCDPEVHQHRDQQAFLITLLVNRRRVMSELQRDMTRREQNMENRDSVSLFGYRTATGNRRPGTGIDLFMIAG
jgi:hypothetical protein